MGTTAVLDVTGVSPVHLVVEVDDSGRAVPLTNDPEQPTVSLRMDVETFVVVAGGRRPVADLPVEIGGDQELGRKVLEAMAVDPVTKAEWTPDEIPDLTGKQALVTGVTSGIGEHTVLELARKGARVVMSARSAPKLHATIDDAKRVLPARTSCR